MERLKYFNSMLLALLIIVVIFISGCVEEGGGPASILGGPSTTTFKTAPITVDYIKAVAQPVPYDILMGNSSNYTGDTIYFKGRVLQVIEKSDVKHSILVATKKDEHGNWSEDVVYVGYEEPRTVQGDIIDVLEGDIIEMWGLFEGLTTYTPVNEQETTILDFTVQHIELYEPDNLTEGCETCTSPEETGEEPAQ